MRRNIKIVAGAAVVGLVAAGGAFAFWSASGSGSGTAAAAADSTPISVSGTAVTGLVPGGPAKVISGTFTNTNPAPVAIPGVVVSISSVSGTCAASNFEIVGAAAAATVPVGASGTWTGPTIKLKDTGVLQDECKGATVNLAYTIQAPVAPLPAVGTMTRTGDVFSIRLAGVQTITAELPYTIVSGDTLKVAVEGGSYQQSVVLATAGASGELLFQGVPAAAGVAIYPLPAGAIYYNVYIFHGATGHQVATHIL